VESQERLGAAGDLASITIVSQSPRVTGLDYRLKAQYCGLSAVERKNRA